VSDAGLNKAMKLTKGGLVWSGVGVRLLQTVLLSASGPRRSRPSQLIAGVGPTQVEVRCASF
jgi:hypothetical protein